jgi:hypothetical protein
MSAEHRAFDELAVGWALHALEPEDEALFAAHLPDCDGCARTVGETTEVMAAMAADLPLAEPSADVGVRLRAAVERTEQVSTVSPGPALSPGDEVPAPGGGSAAPQLSRWQRVVPSALAAAAVAAIVGLGVWNVDLASTRDRLQSTVTEQAAVVDALLRPGHATVAALDHGGAPVATVVARDGGFQVVSHGLAVNDAARTTYVVWGLGGSAPVALGTFDVVRSQMDVRAVGSGKTGLDAFSGFGVSLERGRKAPPEPTEIVATGEVTR